MPERRFLQARNASYKRGVNNFAPRQRFLIVCEGEKTEPYYFKKFPIPPDSIIVVKGTGANTDRLVKETILEKSRQKYDQVWVVFDSDSFTPEHFNNAIYLAKTNGIHIAYSNEAFELWYVLHFFYLDTAVTREYYCQQLSRKNWLGHKYDKKSETLYDELWPHQQKAIHNAKKLLEQYDPPNPISDKPSTTVHLLVEQLNRLFWNP